MKNLFLPAAAAVVLSFGLQAAEIEFDLSPEGTDRGLSLGGLNEVPPTPTLASGGELGSGIFYDDASNLLTLRVGYGSLLGFTDLSADFTAAHIHIAPVDVAGPVVRDLGSLHIPLSSRSGLFSGSLTLTEAEEAPLLAGELYVNIHSTEFPAGEIRGQLVAVPEPGTWALFAVGLLGAMATIRWQNRRTLI
jgi:hypothetical protein